MSPEVFDDFVPRVQAAATTLGIGVALPNEDASSIRPVPPAPWLDIEVSAQATTAIELGGTVWDEQGTIYLHLMIPVGVGMRDGLVMRKALATTFRGITDAAVGLAYRNDMAMDPMGPGTDDGVYRRLSLLVRYHYQDMSVS
jgi:hypothetical protein